MFMLFAIDEKGFVENTTNLCVVGADYYIANYGVLPNYYITKEETENLGWIAWKGNLDKVAPGKMIGGNIFASREEKINYHQHQEEFGMNLYLLIYIISINR